MILKKYFYIIGFLSVVTLIVIGSVLRSVPPSSTTDRNNLQKIPGETTPVGSDAVFSEQRKALLARTESRKGGAFSNNGIDQDATNSTPLTDQEAFDLEESVEVTAELYDLMEEDDLSAALLEARSLLTHPNPEVRLAAFDALDWIGAKAVYDMAILVSDPNEQLAASAMSSFWDQMEELPSDADKLRLLAEVAASPHDSMQTQIAEALVEFHPFLAFDDMLDLWENASEASSDDILWELESLTGESFETTEEWQAWFDENRDELREDYESGP